MSNDTMPCGCEGHADNADLCRYPALRAEVLAERETARRMVARARAEGRAEGFRAARDRAAEMTKCGDRSCLPTHPCGNGLLSRRIRAMEDAEPPLSQLRAATERMEATATPTPAAMLGEAMKHIRTARALVSSVCAAHDTLAERVDEDLDEATQRLDGLLREARAREGQG
jgi:hypothetical protein